MSYNYTNGSEIVGASIDSQNKVIDYYLSVDLSLITESLLIIVALLFLNLMVNIRNGRGN